MRKQPPTFSVVGPVAAYREGKSVYRMSISVKRYCGPSMMEAVQHHEPRSGTVLAPVVGRLSTQYWF